MDSALTATVLSNVAWDLFKGDVDFLKEKAEEFVLRKYIEAQTGYKFTDEQVALIETAVEETPEEIREIEDGKKREKEFKKYFSNRVKIDRIINTKAYIENMHGGTINIS